MGAANDLIVLFLGLETLSLAFYVLAASYRRKAGSSESGLKYFVLGGFSSAFFLYGIALVYGAVGSTNITTMVGTLTGTIPVERNDTLVLAGVALLLVGLGFKIAAVPFHVWTPDVYQGAPTPVTAFMASVGKVAAFAALLRVLVVALPFYRDDWRPVIWVLAVLSLLVGSILAVVQTDVKRMLAYSSISHAGFILVGVEAAGAPRRRGRQRARRAERARLPAGLRRARRRHVRRRRPRGPAGATATPASTPSAASVATPAAGGGADHLPRRPGRRAVHERVHRQVRRHQAPASTSTATRWRSSPWSRR